MILNGENVRCLSLNIRQVNDEYIISSENNDNILLFNITSYEIYQILLKSKEGVLDNAEIAKKLSLEFDISPEDIEDVENDVRDVINLLFENKILIYV